MLKNVDCLKSFPSNQQNHGHKKIIKELTMFNLQLVTMAEI